MLRPASLNFIHFGDFDAPLISAAIPVRGWGRERNYLPWNCSVPAIHHAAIFVVCVVAVRHERAVEVAEANREDETVASLFLEQASNSQQVLSGVSLPIWNPIVR